MRYSTNFAFLVPELKFNQVNQSILDGLAEDQHAALKDAADSFANWSRRRGVVVLMHAVEALLITGDFKHYAGPHSRLFRVIASPDLARVIVGFM